MTDSTPRAGPLAHIRILDLGRIMAAPWATQMMADLGAEVIKIERPGSGDDTRAWGPPFLTDSDGRETRESGYYLSVNRGKKSVTVDIAQPAGQAIIHALAATADVVIDNFKPGALARYGLDAASLRAKRPELVCCSITGFGQDGPRRNQAAYDFAIQAMGGIMSVTGERDERPGAGPQKVGVPIVDLMTGMYAAVAVLAALQRRTETGLGDVIDVAMLDVSAALLANQAMNHLVSGAIPLRRGNQHPNIQPQDVFSCADGAFVLAVGNDAQFAKLCEVVDRAAWSSEPRFVTNSARVRANVELTALLSEAFLAFKRADLLGSLEQAGIPAAPINTVPEVFADPQLLHRAMLRTLAHPLAGSVPQVVSPMRFAEAPLRFDRAPPLLGADTAEVLTELGIGEEELAELASRSIV